MSDADSNEEARPFAGIIHNWNPRPVPHDRGGGVKHLGYLISGAFTESPNAKLNGKRGFTQPIVREYRDTSEVETRYSRYRLTSPTLAEAAAVIHDAKANVDTE